MNHYLRILLIVILASGLIGACTIPTYNPENEDDGDAEISPTSTPTFAPALVQDCTPQLTTNTVSNVRSGPGTDFSIVGTIPQGGTAPVAGRNQDGTWWYIQFPGGQGGYAWIAASITTATCIPATLAIIAAPPVPAAPPPSNNNPPPAAPPSATPTATGGGPAIDPGLLMPMPGILQLYKSPTPTLCIPCLINPPILIPIGP